MPETRGFAELIPYMTFLSDQIVVCKDSGLLATFEVSGKDLDSVSDSEVEALLTNIETALFPLRLAPWKVWFTLKRFETDAYPAGFETQEFSDDIAYRVNQNHKEYFDLQASYATKAYVSFFLAPYNTTSKLSFYDRLTMFVKRTGMMMNDGEGLLSSLKTGFKSAFTSQFAFAYQAHEMAHLAQDFEKNVSGCESILSTAGLRRLKGEEFAGFLQSLSSGYTNPDEPVKIASNWDWFLDSLLPDSRMDVGKDTIKLGDKLISALSIKEWPAATDPSLIPALMSVNSELTFSCAFNFLSNEESKTFITSIKGYANLTKHKLKTYVATVFGAVPTDDKANTYALEMLGQAKQADYDVDSGNYAFGFMNMTLLMEQKIEKFDSDEQLLSADTALNNANRMLESKTTSMLRALATMYPGVTREELHLLAAWSGTLPGQWKEPVRWAFMSTGNLADSAPVLLVNEGERVNKYLTEQLGRTCPALTVLPTPYNTPFYFNFHRGDLAHTMVIGPSRAGKSVMMNFLISQWRKYDPCRTVIFDKDRSCRINTLMHDGEYFDLKEGSDFKINPISLIDDRRNWEFLTNWIANLISFRGHVVDSKDEALIRKSIEFVAELNDIEDKRLFSISTHLPEHLRIHLAAYVQGGQLAHYFDNERDDFNLSTITAFEMGELMQKPQIAGAFIDYAFYRIMQAISDSSGDNGTVIPTLIYLEECWFLFEVEEFRVKVRDWLKTLAKMNAHLVLTTQSMEDMVSSNEKFFASIRDNIPTKIFLPNAKAKTAKLRKLYTEEFGLEEQYLDLIQQGIPKRDYLIVTDDYAKQVICQFGESTLAVLRSDKRAQGIFDRHYRQSPDWKYKYIYECIGQPYEMQTEDNEQTTTVKGEAA